MSGPEPQMRHRGGSPTPSNPGPRGWSWHASAADPAALPPANPASSFRRTVLLTVAGTAIPGLGLIAARRWVAGTIVLAVFGTGFLIMALWALVDPQSVAAMAVRPAALRTASVLLVITLLIWAGVVVASHLALRQRPSRTERVAGGLLVGVLVFAVAAPLAVAARLSYQQATLISSVFKSEKDSKSATRPTLRPRPAPVEATSAPPSEPVAVDPWRDKPRLNVLLLGGDADEGRYGTRTDTVILASIDTASGDTTLFSLPRNTARMPFPARSELRRYFPYGFTDGNGSNPEFFLNAIYNNVPATVPADILGPTDNLGADALKLAVGAALGLDVDYYALINFRGFEKLVNALGGIRVNVNTPIPIGGNTDLGIPPREWISPGENKLLKGREALWYARGRWGSTDFARMDRQRCVINAIIDQANPANLVARYEKVAQAGQDLVLTDIPQEVLPMMVELGLRTKKGDVRSVVFKTGENGFYSANPDFDRMRDRVEAALDDSTSRKPKSSKKAKPKSAATPGEGLQSSEDAADSCAWDPAAASGQSR